MLLQDRPKEERLARAEQLLKAVAEGRKIRSGTALRGAATCGRGTCLGIQAEICLGRRAYREQIRKHLKIARHYGRSTGKRI